MIMLSITVLSGLASVGGCSADSRYQMLSAIFEEFPKPGEEIKPKPVVHKPRRPPVPEPVSTSEAVEVALAAPEVQTPPPRDWRELLRRLPKEEAGGVDWDDALEKKLIQPRAGIDSGTPDQPAFDMNVELVPEGQPLFKVTFPHKEHTEWLACANCHTGIFKMQRGADPITMAKIFAGEYCGRCHGKVSFAVPTGCPRCHAALAAPAGAK